MPLPSIGTGGPSPMPKALVSNHESELTEKIAGDVWASIAFFNLVPVVAAHGPRERPTREMFREGAKVFLGFLHDRTPEAVLVCGSDTWYWLLVGLGYDGKPWQISTYRVEGVPMMRIAHPSAGFSYLLWRPVLDELLNQARALRN